MEVTPIDRTSGAAQPAAAPAAAEPAQSAAE
jgi:hypothetical protein